MKRAREIFKEMLNANMEAMFKTISHDYLSGETFAINA